VQTFYYDSRNRQFGFDWNDGSTPQVRTTYDAASRVTQIWNWDATIDNTYFDDNTLASQREITPDCGDNTPRTVSYTYDADGNRAAMTYYVGFTYNYHYTNRNQLKDINYQTYPPMITYQYDPAGNRIRRSMYNGTTTDYAPVDALNRSAWVRHTFAGGQTARFDYAFDALSRLKYEQRNSGTADGFSYDAAGQVVNTIRDGTLSNGAVTGTNLPLGYDGAGNRTNTWGISYSVNNLNQYTNVGSTTVTPDANGNIQSRDGWTYTYDAQNRLRRAAKGTVFLDFYYDGLNRQITRGVQTGSGSRVTFSVWDGWNLLEERGLGNVLQRIYFYGGKTDELACAFGGVQPNSWVVQDGRGNVSHIFNDSNNLVERYTYGLAGEPQIRDASGNPRSESAVENRFLFQGRDYLKEGAIYDYRNRFYLPALGRFIQPDPIGFQIEGEKLSAEAAAFFWAGGAPKTFGSTELNLYRYCHNDPVNKSDPTGLIWVIPDKLKKDFDTARAAASKDPVVKAIFDRIAADKNHTVTVVESKALGRNLDQIKGTNKGNSSFAWNPRAAIAFPGGRQSPASVLTHEAAHADRIASDVQGARNDFGQTRGAGPFGNMEDRRVILGPESRAANILHEDARSSAAGVFYPVDSVLGR
jgi:RHS repeat-associated protein